MPFCKMSVTRGEGAVKLRVLGGRLYTLSDGVRELHLTPEEALQVSEELAVQAYNMQGLPAPDVHIQLRELKRRCTRLELKLRARSIKLGKARKVADSARAFASAQQRRHAAEIFVARYTGG